MHSYILAYESRNCYTLCNEINRRCMSANLIGEPHFIMDKAILSLGFQPQLKERTWLHISCEPKFSLTKMNRPKQSGGGTGL